MYFLNIKNDEGGRRFRWSFEEGRNAIELTYYPFKRQFGIELDLQADREDTVLFILKIPFLFSIYLSFDLWFGYSEWWSKNILRLEEDRRYDGRSFGIRWIDTDDAAHEPLGTIRISLGHCLNYTKSSDPKWMDTWLNLNKWIFGKVSFQSTPIKDDSRQVLIPAGYKYDAKSYLCKCVMTEDVWSVPRFRKPLKLLRTEVSCEEGVPHPGKGTCDYNQEEGRLYSTSMCCDNFDKAFEEFKNTVIDMRKRYPL